MSSATIPNIKLKTKEDLQKELAEMQERYRVLDYAKDQLQEKLYESGVDSRPTIMTQIYKKESEAYRTIQFIILECEKETGRKFPYFSRCSLGCEDI
jgi:hypothetical protein